MAQQRQTPTRQPARTQPVRTVATPTRAGDTQQLQSAVADPAHASAGALLALQETYGNQAVGTLVSRVLTPPMVSRSASAGVQRKPNKAQPVVKLRSGPQVQLGRKNRNNRRNRSRQKQSSTPLMIAPPPTKLMIAPPKEEGSKPPTGGTKEKPSTPLMIAPPSEPTTESPPETTTEEGSSSEGAPVSSPTVDRIGAGFDMLNDIVDVKDAIGEFQKSGSTMETVGSIAKGGGKGVSAIQNMSIMTGMVEKDSPSLFYSTAISQGAAIVAAGAESYKAFNELRDSWGWSISQIWENKSKLGAFVEKVMDIVKGVADIVKTFFEQFKELEIPLLDKIKQAAVIVQKAQSFASAWTRFFKIRSQKANVTRRDKVETIDHLINLTWDQMKQSAWEILAAGINLASAFAKGTGVGMVYGYLIELGGKIAEGGGKAYVSGLRSMRETSYTPGWLFDKNKTTDRRKEIARRIDQMQLNYLYEAAGLDPGPPRPTQDKIEEALAQPN